VTTNRNAAWLPCLPTYAPLGVAAFTFTLRLTHECVRQFDAARVQNGHTSQISDAGDALTSDHCKVPKSWTLLTATFSNTSKSRVDA